MKIRRADMNDLEQVKCVTCETIQKIYPHYYPKGAVDFFLAHHNDATIAQDIAAHNVFVLEATIGHKHERTNSSKREDSSEANSIIGTVTANGNEICRLFVLPGCQGKGFGTALLDFAEQHIAKQYKTICLHSSLPAKLLYLKRGYRHASSHIIDTPNGDVLCYDVLQKQTH